MSVTDGQAHIARLRAEAARAASNQTEATDEAAIVVALQRLQAALDGAADVPRDALRREIGLVRCVPERGALVAYADEANSEIWHLLGKRLDGGDIKGLSPLVAGAGFEPATFGL